MSKTRVESAKRRRGDRRLAPRVIFVAGGRVFDGARTVQARRYDPPAAVRELLAAIARRPWESSK